MINQIIGRRRFYLSNSVGNTIYRGWGNKVAHKFGVIRDNVFADGKVHVGAK